MITILEALMNAEHNIKNGKMMHQDAFIQLGLDQLHNAIEALEEGKEPTDTLDTEL